MSITYVRAKKQKHVHVVGAGLTGTVAAYLLANAGFTVTVHERLRYAGGLCADISYNEATRKGEVGRREDYVRIPLHGPHIFHTNDERVYDLMCRLTDWDTQYHIVHNKTKAGVITMPVNLTGKEQIASYMRKNGITLTEDPIQHFAYREYSRKQWGRPLEEIPLHILNRVQSRDDYSVKFFTDKYVMRPKHGYTRMFVNALSHPNITLVKGQAVELNDFKDEPVIWTGYLSKELLDLSGMHIEQPKYVHLHTEVKWEPLDYTHVLNSNLREDAWTRRTNCCRYAAGHKVGTLRRVPYLYEYPESTPPFHGDWCFNDFMPGWILPSRDDIHLITSCHLINSLRNLYPNAVFAGRWGTNSYLNMDDCVRSAIDAVNELLGKQHPGLRLCLDNVLPARGSSYDKQKVNGYALIIDSAEIEKDYIMHKS